MKMLTNSSQDEERITVSYIVNTLFQFFVIYWSCSLCSPCRCDGKTVCELSADIFKTSNPCRDTYKYLQTKYNCLPGSQSHVCMKLKQICKILDCFFLIFTCFMGLWLMGFVLVYTKIFKLAGYICICMSCHTDGTFCALVLQKKIAG